VAGKRPRAEGPHDRLLRVHVQLAQPDGHTRRPALSGRTNATEPLSVRLAISSGVSPVGRTGQSAQRGHIAPAAVAGARA
jgi:hypothetical protein